jgi:hypothetical protein
LYKHGRSAGRILVSIEYNSGVKPMNQQWSQQPYPQQYQAYNQPMYQQYPPGQQYKPYNQPYSNPNQNWGNYPNTKANQDWGNNPEMNPNQGWGNKPNYGYGYPPNQQQQQQGWKK